ncbi:MAG TPA: nuclease-related domain-containing protein, partial [Accumulibacter sp.]
MATLTEQIAIVFGVLGVCFAGPAAALFVLFRRKAKARQSRRSPLGSALLRSPGYSLSEKLDEANHDLIWDLALLMTLPLMTLTLFLAQSHLGGLQAMVHLAPLYTLAGVAFIAYMLRKLLKAGIRLDHLKAGYDAEVAVGQELDQLMRQGAATFHDLPAEQFNIDHVVVASEGVFAIESKGFTKLNQGRRGSPHCRCRHCSTCQRSLIRRPSLRAGLRPVWMSRCSRLQPPAVAGWRGSLRSLAFLSHTCRRQPD